MSDDVQISPSIEKAVWKRLGNKSTRKIAEETGLTPEQVLRIRNELLEGVDELTIAQKKQKFLVELEGIAQDAREAAENADQDFKAGLWNAAGSAMKTVLAELTRLEKADTSKVEQLNRMRVNELLRLIDATVAKTLNEISRTYNLEEDVLLGIFQSHLRPAAEELDS